MLLPFLIFFPGHAALSLVFPRANSLGKTTRIFAGIGVSLAIVTLAGLVVALFPWGLAPLPVIIVVLIINIILSVSAIARNYKLSPEKRIQAQFPLKFYMLMQIKSRSEKTLSIIFVVLVVLIAGTLVFSIFSPPAGEQFTEFFILPSTTGTDKYIKSAVAGQPVYISAVIVNRESGKHSYVVRTVVNNKATESQSVPELEAGRKTEIPLQVIFNNAGPGQKVEILLYQAGDDSPLLKDALSLTIDVEPSTQKP